MPPGAQRQRRRHKQREGMQIKSVNLFAGKSLISLRTHRGRGCEGYGKMELLVMIAFFHLGEGEAGKQLP